MEEDTRNVLKVGTVVLGMIVFTLALAMWGCPQYNVWERGLAGEAELRQAEWNRQIKIKEALATLESAKSLSQAEVERARGVAEANKIIGDSLRGNDAYLRYLWITGIREGNREIIYVPTEANLPILEAQRLTPPPPKE